LVPLFATEIGEVEKRGGGRKKRSWRALRRRAALPVSKTLKPEPNE
jgi:hypothetical protein